jgi:hypothetical protein
MTQQTLAEAISKINDATEKYNGAKSAVTLLEAKKQALEEAIERQKIRVRNLEIKIAKKQEVAATLNPNRDCSILKPIADVVMPHFPGMSARLLGPFGLGNTMAIDIDNADNKTVASMSFEYDCESMRLAYVNYKNDSHQFPKGSMGEVNGMNFQKIDLTPSSSVEHLVGLFKRFKND